MKNNIELKNIYSKLAKEYNMPQEQIEKICDSQFEFLKKIMASGEDQQVRLQYLGTFSVPEGRRERVELKRARIKEVHKNRRDANSK